MHHAEPEKWYQSSGKGGWNSQCARVFDPAQLHHRNKIWRNRYAHSVTSFPACISIYGWVARCLFEVCHWVNILACFGYSDGRSQVLFKIKQNLIPNWHRKAERKDRFEKKVESFVCLCRALGSGELGTSLKYQFRPRTIHSKRTTRIKEMIGIGSVCARLAPAVKWHRAPFGPRAVNHLGFIRDFRCVVLAAVSSRRRWLQFN